MSGITQEEIEQAQAREEQGNHDDHCRRDAEAHDAPHEFVLNRRTPVVHPCLCGGAAYYHECAGEMWVECSVCGMQTGLKCNTQKCIETWNRVMGKKEVSNG